MEYRVRATEHSQYYLFFIWHRSAHVYIFMWCIHGLTKQPANLLWNDVYVRCHDSGIGINMESHEWSCFGMTMETSGVLRGSMVTIMETFEFIVLLFKHDFVTCSHSTPNLYFLQFLHIRQILVPYVWRIPALYNRPFRILTTQIETVNLLRTDSIWPSSSPSFVWHSSRSNLT